jgi:multidrug resistance protein MdtO
MPAAQTARVPLPAGTLVERIPLLHFLRQELAPFPGRAVGTARIVVACAAVLVLCMTLRVPEAYLAVWVVTRFAMEESSQTLLTGVVFLLALTIGLAIPLVVLTFAMDQPSLRFCLMATMAALGLFLRRTFVIGALGFVIGLIGTMIMTVPDFVLLPEHAVRATLWLWSVFALGIAAAVAANLLIAPNDPETLLREELTARLRAAEDAIARCLRRPSGELGTTRLATSGVARLLKLLKSAEVVHPSLKARHAQQSTLITLVDRLVTTAAALDLLPPTPPRGTERDRLRRVAEDCVRVRSTLVDGRVLEHAQSSVAPQPIAGVGSAMPPVLVELEHVVDLMQQALGPEAVAVEAASSEAGPGRLFVPDAFSNEEYVRYALKGALAVMVCYTLMSAVDWPGIRTCIITCLIVGLTSEGATIQKGTLRISGALVGAAMGLLAIMLLIPSMESITSLTLLVAAGTAVAAWVVLGSPRISYAGVQIALAFYMCVIQGFEPTWYFYTIRDRLVGILLGNAVITLVFQYIWPVRASDAMWTSLGSAMRVMARLATVGSRSDNQTVVVEEAQGLRLQSYRDFAAAQQLADEAAFELSGAGAESLAARERLQRTTADAQSVFLTQLAIAHQRPAVAPAQLPDGVVTGVRGFDAVVGDYLEVIADRVRRTAHRRLPDLRAPLKTVTDLIRAESAHIASPDVTAQIEGRLALYHELVSRIERLGSADFAP